MHEPARRFRFGLPSFLLLPLWVSPLFLSSVLVRERLTQNNTSAASMFNMLACTAAYAAFFTARSRRRLYNTHEPGPHHVLPAVWAGACYGLLFIAQIIVPLLTAELVAQGRSHRSLAGYLRLNPLVALEIAAAMGGAFTIVGFFLGAFGGSLVGLVFDWRFRRARRRKIAAQLD